MQVSGHQEVQVVMLVVMVVVRAVVGVVVVVVVVAGYSSSNQTGDKKLAHSREQECAARETEMSVIEKRLAENRRTGHKQKQAGKKNDTLVALASSGGGIKRWWMGRERSRIETCI